MFMSSRGGKRKKSLCHHYGSTAAAGRLAPVCRGAGGSCHYYWACYVFRGQLELVNISLLYLLPVLLQQPGGAEVRPM